MRPWIARHPLASFYVTAYLYSWAVGVPLALQAQGLWQAALSPALHYLTAFGPALAALTIRGLLSDRSRSAQAGAERARRSRATWLAIGLLSPLLLFAIAQLAGRLMGHPVPSWRALGQINFLPDLGLLAWGVWFITSGVGEEVGWRGFALPRLQRSHPALTSSVLLSIAWAGWHLPAFFYLPSYAAIGPRVLPGFFVGILAGAIVLTWLYNSSGGSVLSAILWHASFNFVTGSPNAAGLAAAVSSTLVIVWAIAVVWKYGPTTLTSGAAVTR